MRLFAVVLALLACSCKADDKLVVFAAASLRDVFTALREDFKQDVTFNFAGTQELRTQLEHGAAVDVFASADQQHMDALVKAGKVSAPIVFARNELVLVVPKDSGLTAFEQLPGVQRIVVGAPEVPVGRYTEQMLERSGLRARVEAKVVSRELNVRQVLTKVALGEAEAGIVYRTDVTGAVKALPIPPELNVVAEYPIAVTTGAPHAALAKAWVELVLSDAGKRRLAEAGFLAPP